MSKRLNICIVGGGNSAHSLIPLLSREGHSVNLLTSFPQQWSQEITMEYTDKEGVLINSLSGTLGIITDDPSRVVPDADVVLLSLPVSKYRKMLHLIAPYICKTKKTYIGTLYGQGGFNWMMEEVLRKYNHDHIVYFAVGLVPWITRTRIYGTSGINYGPKAVNVVAVEPAEAFSELNEILLNGICFNYFGTGKFLQSPTFLALTLSVDNQIIHLSRLYSLDQVFGGCWDSKEDVPYFYRDYDEYSANTLKELDSDYTLIRKAIIQRYPGKDFSYMLDYLDLERLSYNSANANILESFTSSATLVQIPTPTIVNDQGKYVFDKQHRFFTDDLYYGLIIAKWFAEQLTIITPTLDKIIGWAQAYVGDRVMEDGKLIWDAERFLHGYRYGHPGVYGYASLDAYVG